MDQVVSQFISLLKTSDVAHITSFYQQQTPLQQTHILLFLQLQAYKNAESLDYFQRLSVLLNAKRTMPTPLISQINAIQRFTFFTPLLQTMANFALQDEKQRNVLHYMFVARRQQSCVPFTYVRSLLLFESNVFLPKALSQRESNNLTPLESYLQLNIQDKLLPSHEFTAFIALCEIERTQCEIASDNLQTALKRFKKQSADFTLTPEYKEQKSVMIASYYGISYEQVINALT